MLTGYQKVFFTGALAFVLTSANGFTIERQPTPGVRLRVVVTLPDYQALARALGGDRITVDAIVRGDQDAHFIRPKPSFVDLVKKANLLVATGLDLELWLPTVVDKSSNGHVRSGQDGYVAAAQGMALLEKPTNLSRVEGGVHIYGNPHVTCSPLNMKVAAQNIATGLIKNDPAGKTYYEERLKAFEADIDRRLFGEALLNILGAKALNAMAANGTLIPFLEKNAYHGQTLIEQLGGWLKKMLPLRGKPVVTYHKNWVYFLQLFGMEEAGTVEPKPGISPSPKHVADLVERMREREVKILLAANYFDEQKIRSVAQKTGAEAVIVPLYVGGEENVKDYFQLVDLWTDRLVEAMAKSGGKNE